MNPKSIRRVNFKRGRDQFSIKIITDQLSVNSDVQRRSIGSK